MPTHRAFICHNKANKDVAREIGLFLVSEGIDVWFDEWKIEYGESVPEKISEGLLFTTHLLLFWSKDAEKSEWVKRELNSTLSRVLHSKNVKIIPILLDNTPIPQIISDLKYYRYKGGNETDRDELIKMITGTSPSSNYIKAIIKKYRELIGDDENPSYCPRCGEKKFNYDQDTDSWGEVYHYIDCGACGWHYEF